MRRSHDVATMAMTAVFTLAMVTGWLDGHPTALGLVFIVGLVSLVLRSWDRFRAWQVADAPALRCADCTAQATHVVVISASRWPQCQRHRDEAVAEGYADVGTVADHRDLVARSAQLWMAPPPGRAPRR